MRKYHITCSLGHRLFDVIEGSNIKIRVKCADRKTCPHKEVCIRDNVITFGEVVSAVGIQYMPFGCPACDKRLFDATANSQGIIQIKCDSCNKTVNISVGM